MKNLSSTALFERKIKPLVVKVIIIIYNYPWSGGTVFIGETYGSQKIRGVCEMVFCQGLRRNRLVKNRALYTFKLYIRRSKIPILRSAKNSWGDRNCQKPVDYHPRRRVSIAFNLEYYFDWLATLFRINWRRSFVAITWTSTVTSVIIRLSSRLVGSAAM